MATKIKAGLISFTEVFDGRHREYNDWNFFDYVPEVRKVDGVRLVQRWVSTPELMNRRLFSQGELAASQYLSLCLLIDPVERVLHRLGVLEQKLSSAGRSFEACHAHLSGTFDLIKAYVSPRVAVDADAIPYRPNLGVFVTAQDHAPDATAEALEAARRWYDQVHIPDLLGVHGVVGCWWFEALRPAKGDGSDCRGRTIRVYWLDEEPVTFLDDLRAKTPGMAMIDLSPAYRTLIVGAYRSIPSSSIFDWFER